MKLTKLLFLTPLLLTSCGSYTFKEKYAISDRQFFAMNSTTYGIYYYRDTCNECNETTPYVEEYVSKIEGGKTLSLDNIFFLDNIQYKLNVYDYGDRPLSFEEKINELDIANKGAIKLEDVYVNWVPTLFIVDTLENVRTLVKTIVGFQNITDYLKLDW